MRLAFESGYEIVKCNCHGDFKLVLHNISRHAAFSMTYENSFPILPRLQLFTLYFSLSFSLSLPHAKSMNFVKIPANQRFQSEILKYCLLIRIHFLSSSKVGAGQFRNHRTIMNRWNESKHKHSLKISVSVCQEL